MIAPQIKIIAFKEDEELARYSLEPGEYTVGRSASCHLQLNVQGVSREHARLIVHADGGLALEDRGSANGTFVDQWRVRGRVNVQPNQTIKLGAVTLLQESSAAENGAPVSLAAGSGADLPAEFHRADRYDVGEELAKGGMGAILSARQATIRRTVAMKVMLGKAAASARHRLRFIEEAQITGQLEHPNIVPVHELGVDAQGQVFYTMKLVKGITLKKILQLLREGVPETVAKYQLPALLTVFQKVCDALAFAHSKGVIHRDLKPANIMVGYFGEVLVMDWGLAKVIDGRGPKGEGANSAVTGGQTRALEPARWTLEHVSSARRDEGDAFATIDGAVIGTPHYMSPEQASGDIDNVDVRSDIFALGAILYELLTLDVPFPGGRVQEIIEKIQQGHVIPPHKVAKASSVRSKETTKLESGLPHLPGKEVPESLSAVCMKALAHDPAQRYPRVKDLQADLAAYQTGFATGAEKAGTWRQFQFFLRRHRALASAVTASVGLLLALSTAFTVKVINERTRAENALGELKHTAPTFAAQASALIEQHRFADALENIRSASALDPGNVNYTLQQGHILQVLRRFPEALSAYRRALQLAPGHAVAAQNLAFTQALIRETTAGVDAEKRIGVMLEKELFRQNRYTEALFVTKRFARDAKRNHEVWTPVLKRLGFNIDGTHYFSRTDGLLGLIIDDPSFADLRPLSEMPLGSLNILGTFAKDLRPLRGMPLTELNVSSIRELDDISPLLGMKLRRLNIGGTHVSDISPLHGMPIEDLDLVPRGGGLTDISPLAGMPLETLRLYVNKTADLSVLADMPLRDLEVWWNGGYNDFAFLKRLNLNRLALHNYMLKDIRILAQMPLAELGLSDCSVADLSPLKGKAIHTLDLSKTPVSDLSQIRELPLRSLRLEDCKNIKDLTPLVSIGTLEHLVVPKGDFDLSVLRKLPHLKRISYRGNFGGVPADTAEEFWKQLELMKAAEHR